MTTPAFTAGTLVSATRPTLYFIGVTTGSSSIQRVFPAWARDLGIDGVLRGIDLPLHAPASSYRRVVEFIRDDPLSLGALVTTHKIDLYKAASDLFDTRDPFATRMEETSCISKRDGRLLCHAKDPISSGLALQSIVPPGHWEQNPDARVILLGAGGSSIAISWYLSQASHGADRPDRIIVTNRSEPRLHQLAQIHAGLRTDTRFDYVHTPSPQDNDGVISRQPPGSLVVNATGLGKDAPGSPLTAAARFPVGGLVWELNYRGDLVFLAQARAQQQERTLDVHDGWVYFLHGWTQVIGEVFHIAIPTSGPDFDQLSLTARNTR